MKKLLTFFLTALLAFSVGWAETSTLTNANIVNAGTAKTGYQSWSIPDGNGKTWSAYAIKNYHSNATIDYHYLQIRKFGSSTAYYIQVPEFGTKITQIVMTVSSSSQAMNGGGNSATLYFSSSNSTSATGTGVASGTGASSVTIDCSSLNLNTGYITASAAVRIWDITVTYESGSTPPAPDNWYRKVTNADELIAGTKSIIVYENGSTVVGFGDLNGSRYATGITGLTVNDNKTNIADKDVLEFTLGGDANGWTLHESTQGYLRHLDSGEMNFAFTTSTPQNTEKWIIDVNNGRIRNKYSNKYIYYDINNTYFYIYTTLFSNIRVFVKDLDAPEFSSNGGTFTGPTEVTITGVTGSTIYYTTDGNAPTTSSNSFTGSGSVTITESCTLKAIAVKDDASSPITSADFSINSGSTPSGKTYQKITSTTDLTDGNYLIVYEDESLAFDGRLTSLANTNNNTAVIIETSGSTKTITTSDNIYFTYNSSEGTLKSASGYYIGQTSNANGLASSTTTTYTNTITFSNGDANIVSGGAYLRFNSNSNERRFRYFRSATYTAQKAIQLYKEVTPTTPKVATPTFSPAEGTYTSVQEVTISCATDGATIYYTTDGTTPTTNSTQYTGAITVDQNMTIKAIAVVTGYDDSEVGIATYTIDLTPTLTASPNPLNINDDNTSGGRTDYFTVTGDNLGTANVGLTRTNNEFTPALEATTGNTYAGEYNGTPYWGFTPAGSLEGKVYMTYNGHALSATTAVNLSNGNNASAAVNVNYLYTGPIYLYGNVGVDADHINNFDFSNGVAMTRNTTDGTYSVNITAVGENGGSDSWMFFSKNQGDEATAVSTKFGPDSNGPWYLQGQTDYTGQSVLIDAADTGSNAATIHLNPGEYTVQVNPNDNTFTISALVHAPVISLASGNYEGNQTVAITSQTPGATIYYTTDGTTPTTGSSSIANGGTVTISESCTLKAIAVSNGVTSTVTEATYVIIPPFEAKDYEMLTDIDDLVAGKTYLIVYKSSDKAATAIVMGPVNTSNYGTVIDATENNGIITSTEDMAVVTLAGESGNWTLLTSQGILASPTSNALNFGDTPHTWTISHEDGNNNDLGNKFAIRSKSTSRYLQYNTGSPRFACYTGTQKYVYIYKESSTPAIVANPTAVSIELAAGEAQGSNTFTVGGRNLSEGVTLTLSAEDQAKGFSLSTNSISKEAALAGNVEVTVTYNGQGANETASITLSSDGATDVTVTVNATREPLTVTISPASCNFVGQTMGEQVTISANVAGATIEYSTDGGNTWLPYTGGFSVSVATVGGAVTVMARASLTTGGITYNSETVSETYTRQPKSETLYEKVTDESQIKAGEKYIIVYEGTPEAISDFYSDDNSDGGIGTPVVWRTQGKVVDIAGTGVIPFTMSGTIDAARFYDSDGYYLESSSRTGGGINIYDEAGENYAWNIVGDSNGYYLTWTSYYNNITYTLHYNSNMTDASRGRFRLYNNSSFPIAYLYVLHPAVMAPVITPATGEYSVHQDVTITAEDGTTVYYTTDGSNPATSSTRVEYTGPFAVHYNANGPTTIKAVAVDDEDNVSAPAEAIYTWVAPKVTIRPATRDVYNPTLTVVIGCNPVDATVYYTTDGSEPSSSNCTLYEGPFEVTFASLGDQVTVKAIAYNDDDVPSAVDVATYTYAEKVINVDAPFFSPLEGKNGGYSGIYYGDQTLQIATSTENADIYYVIEQVSGTTPPSSVSDPTKSSTHYTGPISMTVGNSYRVKAIAYIGDFASTISEGYYKILPELTSSSVIYVKDCAEFNALTVTGSDYTVQFMNPVQVVYMSTYANNGTMGEFCYVRDNSDYACIYLGKRNTNGEKVFNMGDWIDGNLIKGEPNIWDRNFHIQLQYPDTWPTTSLGNSEILPEEITNAVIVAGTADGSNSWGHYVHLRKTTLHNVQDYANDDPKHTGLINDGTADAYYYDKFYRWSAGTCSYNSHNDVINHLGDYDQAFFDEKQAKGATFDVYGIVDYYKPYNPPFEICPIDFQWIYKPVITPASNDQCTTQQVVDITVETPEWDGATTPTIYYKTDDMDDWAEFIGPFVVNSDTHVEAYAEMPSRYGDMMRSLTVETDYKFIGIKEPIITPDGYVIEVVTGEEEVTPNVTISTNLESPDAVTLYTTNGEVPTLENGTVVENGQVTLNPIKETTTVTAISYIEVSDGQGGTTLVWSKPVTQTYTFVKSNGVVYDLVSTVTPNNIYVIVNKDAYMGLSTAQNGNNRGSTGVKFTDGTKEHVYGNAELALFVLESASAGRYNFKNINGDGYLTVTTNDVANLSTSATASSYSEAGVTIAQDNGYPATIMFNYDGTNRYLRYFAKGRTFTTNADVTLNENVFLYGTAATPLAVIESEIPAAADQQVTVADALIGAWAVDNGTNKYLWAKDMGYSIAKTNPVKDQTDYVKDILGWQKFDWDQSNWVIIDFANSALEPGDFVGKKLKEGTITGKYVEGKNNGKNYRIVLESTIIAETDNDATKYPGYMGPVSGTKPYGTPYENAVYNTYVTANFLTTNTNVGDNTGFVATEGTHAGDHLFFMNPKLMEVALVYGVWAGNDKFTVYLPNYGEDGVTPGTAVNAWGLKGTVKANWAYNRLTSEGTEWGKPGGIDDHVNDAYFFHAVITPKANANSLRSSQGTADGTAESGDYEIYPLDMSDSGNVTAVRNVNSDKEVVSVRYYNVMGMESEKPFEGINIVVTRYSDGSASTMKVLR